MDGSANPYLMQAGIIAAGIDGINKKTNPGEPLDCNMYEDFKKYPHLPKLPNTIEEAITCLKENKMINKAFGEDVIKSYIKLRSIELKEFNKTEKLDKSKPVSDWERKNTLDC